MIKYFRINRRGQSMLELILSIGMLIIVIVAIVAITTSNIAGQEESEFSIIAGNLGREGLEVVRQVRDTNWLADRDTFVGLDPTPTAIGIDTDPAGQWVVVTSPATYRLYLGTARYTHEAANAAPTTFSRRIWFDAVCLRADQAQPEYGIEDIVPDGDVCASGTTDIGRRVRVTVDWLAQGRPRSITLTEYLYAWK